VNMPILTFKAPFIDKPAMATLRTLIKVG
jgi:hypothetical protein